MYSEDSSKRKSPVVTRTFTISNENPTSSFVTPAEGSVLAGRFTLKAQALPSSNGTASVSKVCLKINNKLPNTGLFQGSYSFGGYADSEGCFDSTTTNPSWEFDSTPWNNGSYLFSFYMVDSSERKSNTVIRTFTINNGNPQVNFLSPSNGAQVSGRFTITAAANPAEPGTASIAKHCLKLNGGIPTSGLFQGSYSFAGYADTDGCFSSTTLSPSWEFNTTNLGAGPYTFSYFAIDSNNRNSPVSTLQIGG